MLFGPDAKRAFDLAVSNVFGLSPSQISLLYFLHYCNAAGGFAKLLDAENGGAQGKKVEVRKLRYLHRTCRNSCLNKDLFRVDYIKFADYYEMKLVRKMSYSGMLLRRLIRYTKN